MANILGRQFKEQSAKASSLMAPLFPTLTSVTYRAAMSAATKALKIEHLRFTPHSVRHGGPSTDMYEGCRGLDEIQKRGRWGCRESVIRYEKHARLLRVFSKIGSETLDRARVSSGAVIKAVLHQ